MTGSDRDPLQHLYDGLPWLGHAEDFDAWEQELAAQEEAS